MDKWLLNHEMSLEQCMGKEGPTPARPSREQRMRVPLVTTAHVQSFCAVTLHFFPFAAGLEVFYKFIFWRMILVGRKGTIFELHYDSVQSATWQAQVTGRKRWTVCPPEEKPYLYEVPPEIYGKGSSNLNTCTP